MQCTTFSFRRHCVCSTGRLDCIQCIWVTERTKLTMLVLFPAPSPPSWNATLSLSPLYSILPLLSVLLHPSSPSESLSYHSANTNSSFPGVSVRLLCQCRRGDTWWPQNCLFSTALCFSPAPKSYCPNDIEKPFKISPSVLWHPAWRRALQGVGRCSTF